VHSDKCTDIHSWLSGDRLSAVTNFEGHKKLVTGITFPVGMNKLCSGSTDDTVRIWDCYTGQCANVIIVQSCLLYQSITCKLLMRLLVTIHF
jgi:WD40 repeat protein